MLEDTTQLQWIGLPSDLSCTKDEILTKGLCSRVDVVTAAAFYDWNGLTCQPSYYILVETTLNEDGMMMVYLPRCSTMPSGNTGACQ